MKKATSKIDDALRVVAAELRGSVLAGQDISGTLHLEDDLEVEITMRVKRRVSMTETGQYRKRAMVLLASEAWHDRCPHYVKNREWSPGSKTHECRHKVTTAIVRKGYIDMIGPVRLGERRPLIFGERFEFVCNHHADVNHPDVIAIVRLEAAPLRELRAKRKREADERYARERQKERELEAEVANLPDSDLAKRYADAIAADQWGLENICRREQLRRARLTKPADLPVSNESTRRGL